MAAPLTNHYSFDGGSLSVNGAYSSDEIGEILKTAHHELSEPVTDLNLTRCYKMDHLPEEIALFGEVNAVTLYYCAGLESLNGIEALPKLRLLVATGCKRLEELGALAKTKISQLDVSRCDRLGDVGDLEGLPLESLNLAGDGQIKGLRVLLPSVAQTLKELNLEGISRPIDPSLILLLRKLESLRIKGSSLEEDAAALEMLQKQFKEAVIFEVP